MRGTHVDECDAGCTEQFGRPGKSLGQVATDDNDPGDIELHELCQQGDGVVVGGVHVVPDEGELVGAARGIPGEAGCEPVQWCGAHQLGQVGEAAAVQDRREIRSEADHGRGHRDHGDCTAGAEPGGQLGHQRRLAPSAGGLDKADPGRAERLEEPHTHHRLGHVASLGGVPPSYHARPRNGPPHLW